MKTTIRIILGIAIVFMSYLCVVSIVTPIQFEEARALRQEAVIKNLVSIRTAQLEFRTEKGYFTADLDSLVLFLKTTPKKEVLKEGALTDKQLEAGLTEHKAVRIIERAKRTGNYREVKAKGLEGFRRDTIETNMIQSLFKGAYTAETIDQIIYIPYSDNQKFELEVNNAYQTDKGIKVPLFEVRAPYGSFLGDQNQQELVNLIDKEEKLEHYAGLKVGSIDAPNNNAGNWE